MVAGRRGMLRLDCEGVEDDSEGEIVGTDGTGWRTWV